MKSIYFKNFLATAIMVLVSFLMIGLAFVFIGQGYVIKSHRDNMESNAMVVSRLTTTIANGRGFTGVMVAWLAKFNPFSMIASSFLLVFMERGAGEISTIYALNQSFADILTGIILFFIIGSEFFITYRIYFTKKSEEVEKSDV